MSNFTVKLRPFRLLYISAIFLCLYINFGVNASLLALLLTIDVELK